VTFIDASAIVAILTREPGADVLVDALETAHKPITSPIAPSRQRRAFAESAAPASKKHRMACENSCS